jgi:hypothetical protein
MQDNKWSEIAEKECWVCRAYVSAARLGTRRRR